jgi:hypothetical protein
VLLPCIVLNWTEELAKGLCPLKSPACPTRLFNS